MKRSPVCLAVCVFLLCSGLLQHTANAIVLLHEFAGGSNDGSVPLSPLTLSGSTLFGTTKSGGDGQACFRQGCGTIFRIGADGTGFTLLHEFGDGDIHGSSPSTGLTLSGSILFGTTESGGSNEEGTIFAINADGSDFRLLHEFEGGPNDGSNPLADLTLSGSTLFGTTLHGGEHNLGTVFAINTDGNGFRLLHEFSGGADDGREPQASLTLHGSTLFGTTQYGGDNDKGTLFSVNVVGSGFTLLHRFMGGANDGRDPRAGLTLSDSTLFGTTTNGGDKDLGTVFFLNTDGTGFTLLHEFAGEANDGKWPIADLRLSGSTLFGTTVGGGKHLRGTIFALVIPEPSCLVLLLAGLVALTACRAGKYQVCPLTISG